MSRASVHGVHRRYTPTLCSCTFLRMLSAARVKVTFCSFLALLKMNCGLVKDQRSCCSRSVEWSEWRCCLDRYLHLKVIEQSLIISSFHKGFLSVGLVFFFFFSFVLLVLEAKTCWTSTSLIQPPVSWGNLLFHCLLACSCLLVNKTFPSADITGVASLFFFFFTSLHANRAFSKLIVHFPVTYISDVHNIWVVHIFVATVAKNWNLWRFSGERRWFTSLSLFLHNNAIQNTAVHSVAKVVNGLQS